MVHFEGVGVEVGVELVGPGGCLLQLGVQLVEAGESGCEGVGVLCVSFVLLVLLLSVLLQQLDHVGETHEFDFHGLQAGFQPHHSLGQQVVLLAVVPAVPLAALRRVIHMLQMDCQISQNQQLSSISFCISPSHPTYSGVWSAMKMKKLPGACFLSSLMVQQNWLRLWRESRWKQMPREASMVVFLQVLQLSQKQVLPMLVTSWLAFWTQCGSRQMYSLCFLPRKQSALCERPPISPLNHLHSIITSSTCRYCGSGNFKPSLDIITTATCFYDAKHQVHTKPPGARWLQGLSCCGLKALRIWSKNKVESLKTRETSPASCFNLLWLSRSERMQAISLRLYQSPGLSPNLLMPTRAIFCMEKREWVVQSLNKSQIHSNSSLPALFRKVLMISAKAICPTRIMQPHPASENNSPHPPSLWANPGNLLLQVIHITDLKLFQIWEFSSALLWGWDQYLRPRRQRVSVGLSTSSKEVLLRRPLSLNLMLWASFLSLAAKVGSGGATCDMVLVKLDAVNKKWEPGRFLSELPESYLRAMTIISVRFKQFHYNLKNFYEHTEIT